MLTEFDYHSEVNKKLIENKGKMTWSFLSDKNLKLINNVDEAIAYDNIN